MKKFDPATMDEHEVRRKLGLMEGDSLDMCMDCLDNPCICDLDRAFFSLDNSTLRQFNEKFWGDTPSQVLEKWYGEGGRFFGELGLTKEGMKYECWQPLSWDQNTDNGEVVVQMPNGKWRMARTVEFD